MRELVRTVLIVSLWPIVVIAAVAAWLTFDVGSLLRRLFGWKPLTADERDRLDWRYGDRSGRPVRSAPKRLRGDERLDKTA
jgi:hypothetical protein